MRPARTMRKMQAAAHARAMSTTKPTFSVPAKNEVSIWLLGRPAEGYGGEYLTFSTECLLILGKKLGNTTRSIARV